MKPMNNLTAILINFLRPRYTIDCIKTLRKNYPDIKIMVGEQLKDRKDRDQRLRRACIEYRASWRLLPYDCGVGAGRNELIRQSNTDYILVGDDDFFYDKKAKVDKMLTFLENTDFDLIGGRIIENKVLRNYQGYIKFYKDHIVTEPIDGVEAEKIKEVEPVSGLRYTKCDLTFNFFVIRKDVAQAHAWDENIKVAYEHHHFFVHLKKAGKKVAFSPDPVVKHKMQDYPAPREYRRLRLRRSDKEYYYDSLGIDYSIGISGSKIYR